MVSLVLIILAIVLLFCAAIGVPAGRISLGWLGLTLWVLSTILA